MGNASQYYYVLNKSNSFEICVHLYIIGKWFSFCYLFSQIFLFSDMIMIEVFSNCCLNGLNPH